MGKQWTDSQDTTAIAMFEAGANEYDIAKAIKRTASAVKNRLHILRTEGLQRRPISTSPAREWNDHLTVTGDALVLPDFEAPYHHAEFVNRCIDLTLSWDINQVILAGDFVHFANFSHWGEDFQAPQISAKSESILAEIIKLLPEDKRGAAIEALEAAHLTTEQGGVSAEMAGVRSVVRELQGAFSKLYYIMGNHENRKLRKQDYGEPPSELLRYFDADLTKWVVSPYYWCNLQTSNPYLYRIEHPKAAGRTMAQDLAVQYQQHIIAGHSHRLSFNLDPSGRLFAIQTGHVCDENRLAYVSQRSAKRDAHALGATIVRDGRPYLLGEWTDWGRMQNCV